MSREVTSVGLLVYRKTPSGDREYLLVHPSGSYNKHAPYYIPKGRPEESETPEQTALREELNKQLDEMLYAKLAETDKAMVDNTDAIVAKTPMKIFVG